MKRLFLCLLVIAFCAPACEGTENVGHQCLSTQQQCATDAQCAINTAGSICGSDGVCVICDPNGPDAALPDAATCTPPQQPVSCEIGGPGCPNYPGLICSSEGQCVCPTEPAACTIPPNTYQQCGVPVDCAGLPGSICGPQNFCICP